MSFPTTIEHMAPMTVIVDWLFRIPIMSKIALIMSYVIFENISVSVACVDHGIIPTRGSTN